MIKVYVVIHIHKFESPSECLEGHVDSKHIGTFYSKNKAIATIEKYKKLKVSKIIQMNFIFMNILLIAFTILT